MALGSSLLALGSAQAHVTASGLALAVVSGALTSGLGYAIWYAALRGLSAAQAAIVQLAVPVVTALGGVALLGERLAPRLLAAAALVLGGIALVVRGRTRA
jgi:drug/metabolite transporter (DMT)-like permease